MIDHDVPRAAAGTVALHLLDARTGLAPVGVSSVTVAAPSSTWAAIDLGPALMAMTAEERLAR